jgi:hypothetical protein
MLPFVFFANAGGGELLSASEIFIEGKGVSTQRTPPAAVIEAGVLTSRAETQYLYPEICWRS